MSAIRPFYADYRLLYKIRAIPIDRMVQGLVEYGFQLPV